MMGKICVITGANSGIGKATALALAHMGAHVVMVCRDPEQGSYARAEMIEKTANQKIDLLLADLASFKAITQLVHQIKERYPKVDVLINNAGVIEPTYQESKDGIELTLATNHIAPFLLTYGLLEQLKKAPTARIITVASAACKMARLDWNNLPSAANYDSFRTYGLSKLCNILFTKELSRRLQQAKLRITANCLHPGVVASNFGQSIWWVNWGMKFIRPFLKNNQQGADTSVYLATSPDVTHLTGQYFKNKKLVEPPTTVAKSKEQAKKLWAWSEQKTGIRWRI